MSDTEMHHRHTMGITDILGIVQGEWEDIWLDWMVITYAIPLYIIPLLPFCDDIVYNNYDNYTIQFGKITIVITYARNGSKPFDGSRWKLMNRAHETG